MVSSSLWLPSDCSSSGNPTALYTLLRLKVERSRWGWGGADDTHTGHPTSRPGNQTCFSPTHIQYHSQPPIGTSACHLSPGQPHQPSLLSGSPPSAPAHHGLHTAISREFLKTYRSVTHVLEALHGPLTTLERNASSSQPSGLLIFSPLLALSHHCLLVPHPRLQQEFPARLGTSALPGGSSAP